MRDSCLGINLSALHHNMQRVRELAPYAKVMAMVKADAYGHGVLRVAEALSEADAFGVAYFAEALTLRGAGITQPIVVLEGVFDDEEMSEAVRLGLQVVVHQEHQVRLLERCRLTGPVGVWVKINTGMNRLGFAPEFVPQVFRRLNQLPLIGKAGLMTHFACADDSASPLTERQISRFREVQRVVSRDGARDVPDSLANSAAIIAWPASHGTWVRPGLMLYGASPFADKTAEELGLKPVMTLTSRVIAVNSVRRGESVGYGATWVAVRDCHIAVIGVGYGDGYPRHARSGTPVLINGQRHSLVGRVSMDMITVELGNASARLGDTAVLWGEGLPADEVAANAGTLSYELFCKVTPRVRRQVW